MAQRTQLGDLNNPLHEAYARVLANGAGEVLQILINEAPRIQRAQHLQATPYERSAKPLGRVGCSYSPQSNNYAIASTP